MNNLLSPKNISSNKLFSNFFSKNVPFAKFLQKCVRLSQWEYIFILNYPTVLCKYELASRNFFYKNVLIKIFCEYYFFFLIQSLLDFVTVLCGKKRSPASEERKQIKGQKKSHKKKSKVSDAAKCQSNDDDVDNVVIKNVRWSFFSYFFFFFLFFSFF